MCQRSSLFKERVAKPVELELIFGAILVQLAWKDWILYS